MLASLGRIFNLLVVFLVLTSLHFLIHGPEIPAAVTLLCFLLLYLADNAVRAEPSAHAKVYVHRVQITIGAALLVGALGLILVLSDRSSRANPFRWAEVLTFATIGLQTGYLLRILYTSYFTQLVRGSSTERKEETVRLALFFAITLVPTSSNHRHLAGVFFLGGAIGFLAHLRARAKDHRRAREGKLVDHLASVAVQLVETLTPAERDAIHALVRNNAKQVERLFFSSNTTTLLVVIYATSLLRTARYGDARRVVKAELAGHGYDVQLENILHLLLAVSHGEEGADAEMFAEIAHSLQIRPRCTLGNLLLALRTAETISYADATPVAHGDLTETQVSLAMRTARAIAHYQEPHQDRLPALIAAFAVPVTWTYILDVQGVVFLKTRCLPMAKAHLLQCILDDPTFAAPYVHLAEWHRINARAVANPRRTPKDVSRSEHLSELLLWIAFELERGRSSRIGRQADALLKDRQSMVRNTTNEDEVLDLFPKNAA